MLKFKYFITSLLIWFCEMFEPMSLMEKIGFGIVGLWILACIVGLFF